MICELCNAKCCKTFVVTITAFDLFRIAEHIKDYKKYVEIRKPDILNYDERFLIECKECHGLLAIKSHPCAFLKNNRCSIWPFAPMACKLYPYNIEGKMVKNPVCPFHAKILFKFKKPDKEIVERAKKENELYALIVREWNKKKGKRKDVFEFMIKRAKELSSIHRLV